MYKTLACILKKQRFNPCLSLMPHRDFIYRVRAIMCHVNTMDQSAKFGIQTRNPAKRLRV